ncbi:MAG: anti-sigma factor antagonist [Streptosporangiales bacterium]|nr:anti-sigma factor antagonist [Streptosporangiales bacterium]
MTAPPHLATTLTRLTDKTATLAVTGEIDLSNSDVLARRLHHLAAEGYQYVILDLSGVTFCDCSGVRALMSGLDRLRANDGEGWLRLVGLQPMVRKLVRIAGVDQHFPVYATEAEAAAGGRHTADPRPRTPGRAPESVTAPPALT